MRSRSAQHVARLLFAGSLEGEADGALERFIRGRLTGAISRDVRCAMDAAKAD
jgi:hypothetical protein